MCRDEPEQGATSIARGGTDNLNTFLGAKHRPEIPEMSSQTNKTIERSNTGGTRRSTLGLSISHEHAVR